MLHSVEIPPPPPHGPASHSSFHTVCVGRGPSAGMLVPPTLVAYGWLPGSSTASEWVPQSSDPLSPAAAKIDWPCVAASWNNVSSERAALEPSSDSHSPQEVEITLA